jgi:hypothetical protein
MTGDLTAFLTVDERGGHQSGENIFWSEWELRLKVLTLEVKIV